MQASLGSNSSTPFLSLFPQDQLAVSAHPVDPVLPMATPIFHPSTWVTQGSAGGGMAVNPWWHTTGGVLLLLGIVSW